MGNVINKAYSINGEFLGKEIFEYKGNKLLKNYDLEGNLTQYAYDGLGRKISEAKCGCLTTYQYDSLGNIAVVCEENGDQSLYTHITYDLLDQVLEKKKTDREGRLLSNISYTYDGNGNVQTIKRNINGQDAVDTFIYDSYDREICHQDPQGAITTMHYDESVINIHGQQVLRKSTKNPQQISKEETFNPHGFLDKQEKLNGASQLISAKEFDYDACGNRLLNQDHVYQGTDYSTTKKVKSTYDSCNRIKSVTRAFGTPEACTTTFTYNQSGKLSSKTLPDGITLNYTYDGLDNLKSIKSSDGKLSHAYSYNRLGHLLNASDDLNGLKIVREVDFQGNILVEEFPNGTVIKKKYDHFHRPLSISLPDGSEVVYQYDPLFLKSVKRLSPSGERLYEHSYQTYDESGYLLSENLIANLGTVIHTTDTKGQSLSIFNDYFKQECKYDSVGNLTDQFFSETKKEFGYDDLSQLISEPDHDYIHDSLYNRIQENEKTFHYNALNEYLPNEDLSCTYDQRGNLIEKSISGQIQKYSYDPLNRLIEAVNGNNKICYSYDPLGRKIGKTVYKLIENEYKKNFQEFFFYDGNNDIGAVSDEGRVKQLRILGLGSHPEKKSTIAIELEGKTYAPYLDCQGNVRGLIDIASKVIAVSYDYSAFGKQSLTNNIFNPWQYASKRFDSDLGLIDFGKRFYDPLLGRWLAVDPAGFIDSHNLYQFNFNNPFRYTDPNGQWIFALPFLCGGFGIGATGAAVVTIEIAATDAIIFSLMTGLVTGFALSDGVALVEHAHRPYMNEGTVTEEDLDEKKKGGRQKIPDGLDYFPDRPMPRGENGVDVPDADVPHTQLTTRKGKQGKYPQAREWGYNDQKVKDIDFTDHGRPIEHPYSPHQHKWEENPTGGSKARNEISEPVEHWKYL